jgi:hypothetical protein
VQSERERRERRLRGRGEREREKREETERELRRERREIYINSYKTSFLRETKSSNLYGQLGFRCKRLLPYESFGMAKAATEREYEREQI